MSDFISKAMEQWLYWRIFAVRVVLFSGIQFGAAWKIATENLVLSHLSFWDWIGLMFGILTIWGGTMLALVDQTLGRIAKGQLPINGDTQQFVKPEEPPKP